MKIKDFGYVFVIFIFGISGAISWNLYFKVYRQADTVNIHRFPKQINDWDSEDLPITQEEKDILETDNVFVRKYFNSQGDEVFLFIVYSENNRKVSHPPEICYSGAGADIMNSAYDIIPAKDLIDYDIRANKLTIEFRKSKQIFFYWFKVGDTFTGNYWKQQVLIALKSFLGQSASSALIRISSDVKDDKDALAVARIKEFGNNIVPLLAQYLP